MPRPDVPGLAGRTIGGYVLQRKLGQGGMGVVFLAVQEGLGREVALKLLPEADLSSYPELGKRFLREASACARLSHPNVVKVFDYGNADGFYFYAMEVLRARNLEEVVREAGIAPLELIFRVARDMASAMEHYHPMGLVHRDIKPANIVLAEDGRPVLTDFGLVKDLYATAVTRAGSAVGTPYYMAPEMAKAKGIPASDIFSLGAVLYRMATGQLPFQGETTKDVLRAVILEEPPAPSSLNKSLPAALENLILNCLEKDPEVRYRDGGELGRDAAAAARRMPVARRRDGVKASPAPRRPVPVAQKDVETVPISLPPRQRSLWPWLVAPVIVAGLVIGYRRLGGPPPAISDVACRAGMKRAIVEWKAQGAGSYSVEWGTADGSRSQVTPASASGSAYSAELAPLEAGKSYRYAVLLPDGSRSLQHAFEAPVAPLTPLKFAADGSALELAFETGQPVLATLEAGPVGSVSETTPATLHKLRSSAPNLASVALRLPDAAGDPATLAGAELVRVWQAALLEPMAREVAARLAAYDPHPFLNKSVDRVLPATVCSGSSSVFTKIGFDGVLMGATQGTRTPHYKRFQPGDSTAIRLGGEIDAHLSQQPFRLPLRSLVAMAPDAWTARKLSIPAALALHAGIRKLAEIDYYAAFLSIPFASGAATFLGDEYMSREGRQLPSTAPSDVVSSPGDAIWSYPLNEALILKKSNFQLGNRMVVKEQDFDFELESPKSWKRAEVTLHTARLETELTFRLRFNDGPTLDLRHDPGKEIGDPQLDRRDLSMSIDPRFLKEGRNRVRVTIAPVAGTRYLGLKGYSRFTAMRLAWEK